MSENQRKLLAAHTKAIRLLEMLAHSMQGLLSVATKGDVKNRAIRRLAHVDQRIAERKEKLGILGKDACSYLNDQEN
jgi:hypothetical protein